MAEPSTIKLYFDYKSPFAYLAIEPSKVLEFYLIFISPRDLIFTYVHRPFSWTHRRCVQIKKKMEDVIF